MRRLENAGCTRSGDGTSLSARSLSAGSSKSVEASPAEGLAITNRQGTQIQRKLGPYIDTFLTSMLLSQVDGTLSRELNARVRRALVKCVAKIEQSQLKDGSWNISGGWAPIL